MLDLTHMVLSPSVEINRAFCVRDRNANAFERILILIFLNQKAQGQLLSVIQEDDRH